MIQKASVLLLAKGKLLSAELFQFFELFYRIKNLQKNTKVIIFFYFFFVIQKVKSTKNIIALTKVKSNTNKERKNHNMLEATNCALITSQCRTRWVSVVTKITTR